MLRTQRNISSVSPHLLSNQVLCFIEINKRAAENFKIFSSLTPKILNKSFIYPYFIEYLLSVASH